MNQPRPYLEQARCLAHQSLLLTSPNPHVGCVNTSPDGQMLGQGSTQRVGGPHPEIMALRDASESGHPVVGATAYVTMEPCSHHGRNGLCYGTLIAAGIKKWCPTTQSWTCDWWTHCANPTAGS